MPPITSRKPVSAGPVAGVLTRLAPPAAFDSEVVDLDADVEAYGHFGQLWGRTAAMRGVYDRMARVARTAAAVLISGESGTGKEVVAKTIHDLSRRRGESFLAVNCGAISPRLFESELFGHEKGSFTGADRQHIGFFEQASGGTLFLDEVTEMPQELQVKLLRVLETGTILRVGSTQTQAVDVRIVAATNKDPRAGGGGRSAARRSVLPPQRLPDRAAAAARAPRRRRTDRPSFPARGLEHRGACEVVHP